jgi:hypothetical protein
MTSMPRVSLYNQISTFFYVDIGATWKRFTTSSSNLVDFSDYYGYLINYIVMYAVTDVYVENSIPLIIGTSTFLFLM